MKRRWAVIFCIVAIGSLWLLAFDKQEIRNAPPKGTTFVAFGDSLIVGQGATVGNDFVSLLSTRLGIPIRNAGVSGDTTETALARIDMVLALKPHLVIVLLGGNDALKRIPRADTEKNLRTIIGRFQEQEAVVMLLGVRGGLLRDPYDGMYEDLARETGALYVEDVLDGLFGNSAFMSDSIHPNNAGYAVIAQRVGSTLESFLRETREEFPGYVRGAF